MQFTKIAAALLAATLFVGSNALAYAQAGGNSGPSATSAGRSNNSGESTAVGSGSPNDALMQMEQDETTGSIIPWAEPKMDPCVDTGGTGRSTAPCPER